MPASYLSVELPSVFALEVPDAESSTGWTPYWQYLRVEWLEQQPDGSYVSGSIDGGSPVSLRVTRVLGDGLLEHVDGSGELFRYRIRALPENEATTAQG